MRILGVRINISNLDCLHIIRPRLILHSMDAHSMLSIEVLQLHALVLVYLFFGDRVSLSKVNLLRMNSLTESCVPLFSKCWN